MINHPRVLCLLCLLAMWALSLAGVWMRLHLHENDDTDKNSLSLVVSATLTLLGLIISFTFSMASTRYDLRKNLEEGEANAIGTEYVRADLLAANESTQLKQLLKAYTQARVNFYQADYGTGQEGTDRTTATLQQQLWVAILPTARATPTPVEALVVSGMNDVLNSQGYTQAAWWNRIPKTAWWFLVIVALFANLLVGYSTKRTKNGNLLLLVLPLVISVSFFLIADIDSPRGGVIRVQPRNLLSLQQSLHH